MAQYLKTVLWRILLPHLMAFIVIQAENLTDAVFAIITSSDSISVLQTEKPRTMELRAECWIYLNSPGAR